MSIRCMVGIHAYRKICEYASLGTLWLCSRCGAQRWT
jgi:hypothetical protein